jgi:hypothetical protein
MKKNNFIFKIINKCIHISFKITKKVKKKI